MSMRDYYVEGFALILTEKEIKAISSKVFKEDYNSYEEFEKEFKNDIFSFLDELRSDFDIMYITNFIGDVYGITKRGTPDYSGESVHLEEELIIYIPSLRFEPALFSAPYHCMDDIVSEMREKLANFLPTDYNYSENIKYFSGSCFG